MMISPSIVTARRPKGRATLAGKSLRNISRRYFASESAQVLVIEILIFSLLAAAAIWPIVNAAAVIQIYLL